MYLYEINSRIIITIIMMYYLLLIRKKCNYLLFLVELNVNQFYPHKTCIVYGIYVVYTGR